MKLIAPAKINLTLEVLGKRPDGYHEIVSIVQTISLADSITIYPAPVFAFHCQDPVWQTGKSLAVKAARLFQQETGVPAGAAFEIYKNVPVSAGLGGESSLAAATLVGLNRLTGAGVSHAQLCSMAAELGSDVPFFITGGTACLSGRGEKVRALPPLPHRWVLLMVPEKAVLESKTERMYAGLGAGLFTSGDITARLASRLETGRHLEPEDLFNVFENIAFERFEGLAALRRSLQDAGLSGFHLSGSGPAMFMLERSRTHAEKLLGQARSQGLSLILAETLAAFQAHQ